MVDIRIVITLIVALVIALVVIAFSLGIIGSAGPPQQKIVKIQGCQTCLQGLCATAVVTGVTEIKQKDPIAKPCAATACADVSDVSVRCG